MRNSKSCVTQNRTQVQKRAQVRLNSANLGTFELTNSIINLGGPRIQPNNSSRRLEVFSAKS